MADFYKTQTKLDKSSGKTWHKVVIVDPKISVWLNNQDTSSFALHEELIEEVDIYYIEDKLYTWLNLMFKSS